MSPLITIKRFFGMGLALSLAGGGLVTLLLGMLLLNVWDTPGPVKNSMTVNELLRDQNPGQISYISFPITDHLKNQLESHRKFIPFSESYRSQ